MPLLGQASGGWTESSSALRLLNVGIRNSVGVLTDDSFTQTNPPAVTTAGTISTRVDVTRVGVLSGSVAFTRPDAGENHIGGPGSAAVLAALLANALTARGFRALGLFINSANGNPYENTPGVASGIGPYVSAMGTYATALYETNVIVNGAGDPTVGNALTYLDGVELVASRNGYLMPKLSLNNAGNALIPFNIAPTVAATGPIAETYVWNLLDFAGSEVCTKIGILKMAPDSVQTELVFDQRI
jgi:hypothetical protein